jgi:hypothetical protein
MTEFPSNFSDFLINMFKNQTGANTVPVMDTLNTPTTTPTTPPVVTPTPTVDPIQQFLNTLASYQTPTVDPTTAKRKEYAGQVENTFGSDYGQRNISSGLLDDTINQILSEQKNDAATYLDRGRARGIYNDVGYNAGASRIGTASEAGRSKLYSLGHSVIDKYRSDANSVRDKAYSAANAWTDGQNFSLDPYINQGNEVINNAKQFGGGDLRNAFGGTKLFDFGDINNRAGQAQGAINTRDTDVLGAISARKKANSFGRGLGSQGAF